MTPELRVPGEFNFINDAGVAGEATPCLGCKLPNTPPAPPCGARKGDGLADLDLGNGGGGISDVTESGMASGEVDPFSESVMPPTEAVDEDELAVGIIGVGSSSCWLS